MAQLCARCSKPPTTLASLKIEIERSESFALTVEAPHEEELQAQTATQDRLQAWRSVHNVRPCQQAKSTQLGTDHVVGRKEVVHFRQDGANDAYPQLIANLPTAESTSLAVTKRSLPRLDSVWTIHNLTNACTRAFLRTSPPSNPLPGRPQPMRPWCHTANPSDRIRNFPNCVCDGSRVPRHSQHM